MGQEFSRAQLGNSTVQCDAVWGGLSLLFFLGCRAWRVQDVFTHIVGVFWRMTGSWAGSSSYSMKSQASLQGPSSRVVWHCVGYSRAFINQPNVEAASFLKAAPEEGECHVSCGSKCSQAGPDSKEGELDSTSWWMEEASKNFNPHN